MTVDRLVDIEKELELGEDEEIGEVSDLSPKKEEEVTKEEPKKTLPKQYEGKSVEDLIEMNMTAQKQISKQGNEIGELRKLTDKILQQQLDSKTNTKTTKTEDDLDWDFDTQGSVEKVVDSRVKALEERIEQLQRQELFEKFESRHPTWEQTANDPQFLEWVQSSRFRSRLYQQAHNHDYDAADDLFSEWEDRSKVKDEREQIEAGAKDLKRKEQLKDASLEKGGSGGTTRKIYRRADLINLRLNDPAKYDAMSDEIKLAYAEKRVR